MDRSVAIGLVNKEYSQNDIGVFNSVKSIKKVYANVQSITRAEYYEASEQGLNPSFRFTMFEPDYDGQDEIVYLGKHYNIYRTYVAQNEMIELYAEEQIINENA